MKPLQPLQPLQPLLERLGFGVLNKARHNRYSRYSRYSRCGSASPLSPPGVHVSPRLSSRVSPRLPQVVLFFPADKIFWEHTTDFFGRTVKHPSDRGLFFLFCNWFRDSGHACLIALAAGKSAAGLEELSDDDCASEAMIALESMFGDEGQVHAPTCRNAVRLEVAAFVAKRK